MGRRLADGSEVRFAAYLGGLASVIGTRTGLILCRVIALAYICCVMVCVTRLQDDGSSGSL